MSFLEIIPSFVSKKSICSVFGHKIVIIRNVTGHFREYKCTCCEIELTNDLHDKKMFLTPELRAINEILSDHYIRRQHSLHF